MILRSSPASPFGRLVKIAAHVTGMMEKITIEVADTNDPADSLRQQNPLGKIPALVTDQGVLYDSRVILDWLDERAGGGVLVPASGAERHRVLTRLALGIGLLDAAILVVYEGRFRPADKHVESFVAYQRDKISRALVALAADYPHYNNAAQPDAAEITLACSLDYLDFRQQLEWRDHVPQMASWMQDFAAAVPGYGETLIPEMPPAPWRQF